jgi:uncharacterized protein YeeX (DUF496 family)
MYTNKPIIETEIVEFDKTITDNERRIEKLENIVRQLSEQIHKMSSALALNSRQIRRQNTDIHNVTTVLRNK